MSIPDHDYAVLHMLKLDYDVVGGYNHIKERERREGYEINEILLQSMIKDIPNGHRFRMRAQRRRIYMFSIRDDSLGDDLPVFMVRLQDGNTVTCYPCDIEELAMDEIADDIELHEGGEVI